MFRRMHKKTKKKIQWQCKISLTFWFDGNSLNSEQLQGPGKWNLVQTCTTKCEMLFVSQQLQSWRQRETLTIYLTNIEYRICSLVTSHLRRKQHKNNRRYQKADLRRTRKLNKIKVPHPHPPLVPRNSLFYNWSRWCDRIPSYCSLKTVSVHQPLFINEEGALVE